ncbi:hypothetical protein OROMI_026093 [Orobanche minor]
MILRASPLRSLDRCSRWQHPSTYDTKCKTYAGGKNLQSLRDSVDWREFNAVTPVQKQGKCASCWAFSVIGAVEGITKIKTGRLIPLSVQELIDCDNANMGCNKGLRSLAFEYIKDYGVASKEDYPYKERVGFFCKQYYKKRAATITGYEWVPAFSEHALMKPYLGSQFLSP